MAYADDVRRIALGLPESIEAPHFDMPSFRVRKAIFATLPDADHAHVMVSESEIREAVAEHPHCCSQRWWGKRLAAVRVELGAIDTAVLDELLTDAWRRKAPRTLVRAFDANSPGTE
ncbi:MmcQ/YjbR family DNA-binding protein [Nocardia spumae]|uniref:MmcQ/YjbR family DNA-binding protein n=1 Tax=Nocardia spumae TaxID=2887190 RepID=UPI001D15A55A|nr:MmcQ/YjbR family DNA-binding protein [Nocardia spumae]